MGILNRVKRLMGQSDSVAVVENTGPATASGSGSRAVSGIDYT